MYRAGGVLGTAVLACMPLDAFENWCLWRMIESGPSGTMAMLAGVAASAKFVLVLTTALWCLVALSRRFVNTSPTSKQG
jgi:hypothetical protein